MNNNLIGQTIRNRYHIIEQVGIGGSGVTFIAEDRQCFNDLCIVKQLKPQSNNPHTLDISRRLFDTEAEILGKLGNHDCIPRLLAYFEENQDFFIVQEFIKGQDFSEEIASKPYFSQEDILTFLEDILETLVFVQEYGVVHRDIKPSNLIRRNSDDKIVLIDFGSVKQVSTQGSQHKLPDKPTVIVGTENYVPIEQVMGNPGLYSDIYALGIVAVEALTGKLPRDLPVNSQGELIWHNSLPDKSQYNPRLLKIIDKAICHHYKQRYQSAKDFLADIKALKNNALLKSQFKSKYLAGFKFFQSNIIKTILLFILVIILGLFFDFWQSEQLQYTYYENQDYGVKISYPENWQVRSRDDFLISGIIFLSPLESRQDSFRENVSVFVENLVSNTSLNEYTAESIAEIKRFSDPNITDAKLTVLGSYEGRSIVYEGEDRGLSVKRMQIWTVTNSKAYTITYTAQPNHYETFLPTVKQMIASFDLLQ